MPTAPEAESPRPADEGAAPKVQTIVTGNATAVAANIGGGTVSQIGVANAAVPAILCAVNGPDSVIVDEVGTWAATAPGAVSARWDDQSSATQPFQHAWATPGSYDVELHVTYVTLGSLSCHRTVTVVPSTADSLPSSEPGSTPTTPPGPEPDPATGPTAASADEPAP